MQSYQDGSLNALQTVEVEPQQIAIVGDYLDNKIRDLNFEEMCEVGNVARSLRDVSNIAIGRLALQIETRYGEKNLAEFAKAVGLRKDTVVQYRWVAEKFPELQTYGKLSYSYYRLAAGTDSPREWIEDAEQNNLTVAQLKAKIQGLPLAIECQHEKTEIIYRCVKCHANVKIPRLQ